MHTPVKTSLGVAIIVIMALTFLMFIYYCTVKCSYDYNPQTNIPIKKQRACTEEAKLCPDGSYVGRTGSKCEFAPCPEIVGIADKIIINAPAKDSAITSPVAVSGRARGTWFFEGSFPVEIYDANNKLLGQKYASFVPSPETPEWMTTEFVNFSGTIEFSKSTTDTGYILFKKDNPSDQRELDEEYKLPIKFNASVSSSDSLSWRSYKSEELGFGLGFPETWKGYAATENNSSLDKSVCFSFKNGHQPFCIFTVRVLTAAEWANTPNKSALTKITEDAGKVYICDGCCGKGLTDGGGQFDNFQEARCKEGGKILETFELVVDKG